MLPALAFNKIRSRSIAAAQNAGLGFKYQVGCVLSFDRGALLLVEYNLQLCGLRHH